MPIHFSHTHEKFTTNENEQDASFHALNPYRPIILERSIVQTELGCHASSVWTILGRFM